MRTLFPIFENFAALGEIRQKEQVSVESYKMEFYEEWIPLSKLYPITFGAFQYTNTPSTPMNGLTISSLAGCYDPPSGYEDEYADASDAGTNFLTAMPGLKNSRKPGFVQRVTEACVRIPLHFHGRKPVL